MQIVICCDGMRKRVWDRKITIAHPVIDKYKRLGSKQPYDEVKKCFISKCPECKKPIELSVAYMEPIKVKERS
jgi:hypothetical protein